MIEIHDLSHSYGKRMVLFAISLSIPPGEFLVIQGPSGSGKTTLLRLIAGLEYPTMGEILIDGRSASTPERLLPPHQRGIGIVFQRSALWPHMTVAGNLAFVMNGTSKTDKNSRIERLLQLAGLEDVAGCYPSSLSGGEARRVELLRALAVKPVRLLLDEPLTNLDLKLKEQLLKIVLEYAREQPATLLLVTHDRLEAETVGGRIVRLENGRLA